MNSTRDELIKDILKIVQETDTGDDDWSKSCNKYCEEIATKLSSIILERERRILEEIEKPLRYQVEFEGDPQVAVDEALAIINRYRKGE